MAFILVIDDHETSLDALATIIRSGGHEVITARNEEEACRCCEHHAAPDLLILDVKLRGVRSGVEVARELTTFYPGAGVVFISGTSLDALRTEGLLDLQQFPPERRHFLEKPFTAKMLTHSIDEALAAPGTP